MGNFGSITLSSSVDVDADVYMAIIQVGMGDTGDATEELAEEVRIAEKIVLQAGPEPSYAIVTIPLKDGIGDEDAFSVAFQSIARGVKMNTRCTITHVHNGKSTALLSGTITDIQNSMQDSLIITVQDDRYLLEKVTVFGQIQHDPSVGESGHTAFVASEPCVFNMFGFPNCIDTPHGPRFSPTIRWGWSAGGTAEPAPGSASQRARSWRTYDIAHYLRSAHYGGS